MRSGREVDMSDNQRPILERSVVNYKTEQGCYTIERVFQVSRDQSYCFQGLKLL